MKTIHILLTYAALAIGLAASAVAQQPAPAQKRETVQPPSGKPKPAPGTMRQKPVETACETPRLDLYPKDELRPMTGKAPDLRIPVRPDATWGQLCKLGRQTSAGLLDRS